MPSPLLAPPEPAPSRGQYDRALSRLERQQRQRERLLFFAAEEYYVRGSELTVAHVVEAASAGRNTFYEYFDDLENALDASGVWVASRLERAFAEFLHQARTPIARLKILSSSWFQGVQTDPAKFAVLVRRPSNANNETLTEAVRLFVKLLVHAVGEETIRRRSGATPYLDLAVAHAVAGLTAWSLQGGRRALELEPAARAVLLDVFR